MAIPGQEQINVSNVENQAFDSDSLFDAFHKVQNNFTTLFNSASPYTNIRAGSGITANADAANSTITITNTGVTSLVAGTGVTLANANGAYTISASGGNGQIGVTNVNMISSTLNITGSPIISNGSIRVELPNIPISSSFVSGTYSTPDITVDRFGRITAIANNTSFGTVTSVNLYAAEDSGIVIYGGEVTTSGTFSIVNTGVKSIAAGTGINITGTTGDVTISAIPSSATVSRVQITSNTLNVTGGPITTNGSINLEIPDDFTFSGAIVADAVTAGEMTVGNSTANTRFGNGTITMTSNLSVGENVAVSGSIIVSDDGEIGGNLTVGANLVAINATIGQYVRAGSANITSIANVGSLVVNANADVTGNLNVTANANVTGNIKGANANITANLVVGANANITGNLNITANANVTGNIKGANANITANLVVGANANITGNLNVTANANITGNINLSGNIITSKDITANNITANTYLNILGGALYYSDNGKYIGLTTPGGVSANYVFGLPSTDGSANSFLSTNGTNGTLSFRQPASSSAPSTSSSTGVAGQIAYDGSYIYVCVGTNSWKRASLSTW